jgi:hypothetical protein
MGLVLLYAPYRGTGRDLDIVVGQEARRVRLQRLGGLLEHFDARCIRPWERAIKELGYEA